MRSRTLLSQVLAVNIALVTLTAFVAAVVGGDHFSKAVSVSGFLLITLAVLSVIFLNSILIRRRLRPIGDLVRTMDQIDLSAPGVRATAAPGAASEVKGLTAGLNRMLERLEEERRQAGRAVLRGQEQERQRVAQDLHDEVNQALTAILLRLQATIGDAPECLKVELEETKRLVNQAMFELLTLARQLRPAALDDHGLMAVLATQAQEFSSRTGLRVDFHRHGDLPPLSDEEELVIYRVTQESLSNIAQHANADDVDITLSFVGRPILRVEDNGVGFDAAGEARSGKHPRHRSGLGLSGMRERALLIGGMLNIYSNPERGTTVELTLNHQRGHG